MENIGVINTLLIEKDTGLLHELQSYLEQQPGIHVVGAARGGREGLYMAQQMRPRAMVMELALPEFDGLGILEELYEQQCVPAQTMVVTSITHEPVHRQVKAMGAAVVWNKPVTSEKICEKLLNWDDRNHDMAQNLEVRITNQLLEMGVPPHLRGYHFLRDAVGASVNGQNKGVTTMLYPMIAERYNTTPVRVERAIRHAIEVTWNRAHVEVLQRFFGYTINEQKGKPTNSECIAMLADRIKLSGL